MIAIFPEIAKCVLANNLPRLIKLIKQYYAPQLKEGEKVNLADLIKNAGIPLRRAAIKELAVILAKDSNGAFEVSIILNNKLAMAEREEQFLLAHLLGHFFCHIQPKIAKGEWGSSGFRELVSPYQRFCNSLNPKTADMAAKVENEADLFAAALLGIAEDSQPVSFAHAEHKIKEANDQFGKTAVASQKETPLHSDQVISAKMPRSFAASSYDQMKHSTTPLSKPKPQASSDPAKPHPAVAPPVPISAEEKEKTLARGLDRLRKLAKRIDHSVE